MLQFILSRLAYGAIYSLISKALPISYCVARVINFAQGQFMMLAIMAATTLTESGHTAWLAVAAGLVSACLVGPPSYFVTARLILIFDRSSFGWLVSTLGFGLVIENATAYVLEPDSRAFPALLNNIGVHIGSEVLTEQQIFAIAVALVFAVAFEVLHKQTLLGKVGMATATRPDPGMASAIGVNTTFVTVVTFLIAGLFAGVVGVLIARRTFANPYLGNTYGTAGFVAIMIGGGTERPATAMFAGFLLGPLSEGVIPPSLFDDLFDPRIGGQGA